MTVRQQWMIVGVVVAIFAVGLGGTSYALRDELFHVDVGSKMPEVTGFTLGERQAKSLADYRGQVVLLNVWATWCPPCQEEMPSIEAVHRAFAPAGLRVVAVSVDDAVGDETISEYVRELGLSFEIWRDSARRIDKQLQVTGYPETFVIDREGVIRKKWIGPDDWNSPGNRALIAQLLGVSPSLQPGDTARRVEGAISPETP